MLGWFQKAKKAQVPQVNADQESLDVHGKYTDHCRSAYDLRMQIAPLHGDELEAFDWILNKMEKDHPEARSQSDLIDFAFDDGWFVEGKRGELRVVEEPPYEV